MAMRRTVGAATTQAEGVFESPSKSPGPEGPKPGHEQTLDGERVYGRPGRNSVTCRIGT